MPNYRSLLNAGFKWHDIGRLITVKDRTYVIEKLLNQNHALLREANWKDKLWHRIAGWMR